MPLYYQIAILSPPYNDYTYAGVFFSNSLELSLGTRVLVPFGKNQRIGVVIKKFSTLPKLDSNVQLKSIFAPLEKTAILDQKYLDFITELSLRQSQKLGNILGNHLPLGMRSTEGISYKIYFPNSKPQIIPIKNIRNLDSETLNLIAEKWSTKDLEIITKLDDEANEELILLAEPPFRIRPNAIKQRNVLDFMLKNNFVTKRKIIQNLGQEYHAVLDSLIKQKMLASKPIEIEETGLEELIPKPSSKDFELNEEQVQALANLEKDLNKHTSTTHLLYGVTGSGKTAVFIELAKKCLAQNKNILILAPELAIALKLKLEFANAISNYAQYFYHGYQNPKMREKTFIKLNKQTNPAIIIGTRSALFLNIAKLGAIILDEEHDGSFKQDEGINYQAKELAWLRAQQNKALLVFASATPDIKSYYASQKSQIGISSLTKRVQEAQLPRIEKINIAGHDKAGSLLSDQVLEAIKSTIQKNEQVVVLLNRRGYAPNVYCLECAKVARCPHCDIALTYHKHRSRLICHYCDYEVPFPSLCSNCHSSNYIVMGEGVERIQEQLYSLISVEFPQTKILRLDRDTTQKQGQMESILTSFANKEAQILIGTQMLSKGHHFEDVTLVVIADADIGLNMPDYRASERTFQLITQSSGRAGRGQKAGKVLLQTREPSHYLWQFVENNDYLGFYNYEIALREKRNYPPFTKLGLIRISFNLDYAQGQSEFQNYAELVRKIAKENNTQILGPAPAPLPIIKAKKRFQCLIKADNWQVIRTIYQQSISKFSKSQLKFELDLDPVNML